MEVLPTRTVSEPQPELPEPAPRQPLAGGEDVRLGVEPPVDLVDRGTIALVAGVVPLVHVDDALIRRAVDVTAGAAERREPASDESLAQTLGRDRQISHRREPAEALAEDAPAIDPELAADGL